MTFVLESWDKVLLNLNNSLWFKLDEDSNQLLMDILQPLIIFLITGESHVASLQMKRLIVT